MVEPYDFVIFVKEFVENNALQTSQFSTGESVDQQYPDFSTSCMNSKMVSFDANFGDSFHVDTELFAMKMWQPINAVKFFTYDFRRNLVAEVYEIPLSGKNLDELQLI